MFLPVTLFPPVHGVLLTNTPTVGVAGVVGVADLLIPGSGGNPGGGFGMGEPGIERELGVP